MAFAHILFLLIFPSLSAILAAGQTDCPIKPNSAAISAGSNDSPWLSPSEEFAFGFRLLPHSAPNDEDRFLLSIWFNKIPEQTIVWSKNDHPVPRRSKIQLTNEGQLVLYNHQNVEQWRADIESQEASCAAMLDSGNFVLMNATSPIWETFNVPTDTILPSQRLSMGGSLTSRQSDTDYSNGRFQLRMQKDGNLVLYTLFLPTQDVNGAYWSSRTNKTPSQLVFDEAGYIYIRAAGNENTHNLTKDNVMGSRQDFWFLARLDADGVFRHYHRRRGNSAAVGSCPSSWSVVQTTPDDICSAIIGDVGSGACGYNSYCVNSNGRPSCECPQGYSFLDPLNTFGGCKPDFPSPSCYQNGWETDSESVDFKELNNTDWPFTDYELQEGPNVNKDTCKQFCLLDCFCAVAIYNENRCWKKRFPLSNGRKSDNVNRIALIKVPRNNVTTASCPAKKDRSALVILLSAFLGSSIFLNCLLLGAIGVVSFLVYHNKFLNLKSSNSTVYGMRVYSYKELEKASGGFKENLGRGSFGTVYKGYDSKRYIAIKRLDKVEKQGEKEFATEVKAIGQTHHKNLVTLLGYCNEGDHRLLVYEYMSNGSLADHLFGLTKPHWNQRMQIALGIARGLAYLHEECSSQIIHCDVKPQNILLDEYLAPKISDFGMAKLLLTEQSRAARTHIRGTVGYFAPEWFRKASVSTKVDVYSFGVMLLEIICCTSSVGFAMGDEDEALIDWVYECYSKKRVDALVENDEEARNEMKSVERVVMVGIWCIQEEASLRPSMRRVAQMLEGVGPVSVPPRPSIFISS
ncbi:G-type lectin S-receptor-like serine/threonine-protein kinase LECRK1 [Salvia hispanica]|uniref:G-type lectin S-receptor-like serine/threonine-protein kinase LECRK1 n=1 Tax=Salvia hispanica TaxID=49212 RepID=UPI00200987F5|nr:G-type lectin S-receptor-like serine/threonine-protein kinase LECRK1 [Salvia hispanica]